MSGFMKTVFKGYDIKINRKSHYFFPPLAYLRCISKCNMGVLVQIIDTVFKNPVIDIFSHFELRYLN